MAAPDGHAVVCVHGLWLSGYATGFWRKHFSKAGYAAHAFSSPSVTMALDACVERLADFAAALPEQEVHFTGHSLGGVLIAAMLAAHGWKIPGKRLGRIVLAGSPYQGSHVARELGRRGPWATRLLGRALADWQSGHPPAVPAGVALGVIAGTRPLGAGRIFGPGLPRPHDGTVSVAETRVEGAREHLTLAVSHTEMLMSARVAHQLLTFVEHGKFSR